ncbi:MAG: triple tyrosine motif-containing protein [Proteobacteria bacterium]|nr:triple tyrosine motif-containing protein [Pseudomonadota bacterium]
MLRRSFFWFLVVFFVESAFANFKLADQPIVLFDRIKTTDGLSPGGITSFAQDRLGFIWIGTLEGLNHFDGYRIENYYHDKSRDDTLLNDNVHSLLADSKGRLWVGTYSGLSQFDFDTKTFEQVDLGQSSPEGQRDAIFALYEDRDQNVWVGSGFGLTKITPDGHRTLYHHDITRSSVGKGIVRAIFQSSDGLMWIGTEDGGLSAFDAESGQFQDLSEHLPDLNVRDILEDDHGQIWIATYSGGLAIFDRSANSWHYMRHDRNNPAGLSSDRIRSLLKDQSGAIWVGTDQGLNLWRPSAFTGFRRYVTDPTNSRSIGDNTVVSLFQDEGGVIWVGTIDSINKWNARIETFPHFKPTVKNEGSLVSYSVTSFAEAPNGDVWVGNFAGLNRWNSEVGRLESYSADEVGLNDRRVMSLLVDSDALLIGTMIGGLNVMRDGKVTETFVNVPDDPSSLSSNGITKIYRDRRGRVWLSTYGGGINQYLGNGKFRRYPDSSNAHGSFSDLRCLDIRESKEGHLWIATDGGGVVVMNPDTGDTKIYRHDPNDPTSISSNNNITLLVTDDAIWVGSKSDGVNRFDPETQTFRNYNKIDGLSSDSVYGILEDASGLIWMSSGKGLSVLDPITEEVTLYDSTHGLQSDDFHSNAFHKLEDGTLLFGGANGFNAFRPERKRKNESTPPVRLTKFTKFNKEVQLERAIDRMDQILLDYTDSVIGFEYSSLDYTAPEKNQYRYKLDGFNEDWVEAGRSRTVTYTNLDPDSYTFHVQGSNNDGVWNTKGASIGIVVKPPLWATWWAYTAYGALLVLFGYILLQQNVKRLRREEQRRYAERLQLYIESLEEATDCVLIADQHTNLIYANEAIRQILNDTPADALGKPLLETLFQSQQDRDRAADELSREGRYHGEVQYRLEDGNSRTNEVTIAAVTQLRGDDGSGYVSISRDVTDRKQTEAELENHRRNLELMVEHRTIALEREVAENKAAKRSIAESLREKELLLKEVHHRVKNNMQVISSLLNIQAETTGNERFSTLLGESQQRIKSMSLIHENLYQSDNLLEINFDEYINMLANSLCRFYTVPGVNILLDVDVQDVSLDIETAVPCGLIINELVSNSLKHAFSGHQTVGAISIKFTNVDGCYVLRISDDGAGLPDNFCLQEGASMGMGMEIVSILTEQLDGKLSVVKSKGAAFEIAFPSKVHHVQ